MRKDHTILVIEDHDSVRLLLENVLSKNYDIITCKDAIDALAWLRHAHIPDLILLDLNLPRISGLDFLENLKNSGMYKNIPVIILSGDTNDNTKKRCYDLDISDFIPKPFNPIELNKRLHKILNPQDQMVNV